MNRSQAVSCLPKANCHPLLGEGRHEPRHVPSHPLSHFCHTSTMGRSDLHKKGKPHNICASKAHKGPSKQDPLAVLGENIVVVILGCLPAEDLARCTTVSKEWKHIALSDELWSRHCMVSIGIGASIWTRHVPQYSRATGWGMVCRSFCGAIHTQKCLSCNTENRLRIRRGRSWTVHHGTQPTWARGDARRSQRKSCAASAGTSGEPSAWLRLPPCCSDRVLHLSHVC